jgi:hypothetical protein
VPSGNGHQQRQAHGEHGDGQRGFQPLPQQLRHRYIREDGDAQVALRQLAHPQAELLPQRTVQSQGGAQPVDVVGGGQVARDQRGRISR